MTKAAYIPKAKAQGLELKPGFRFLDTMQDDTGIEDNQLLSPYWLNAKTGELLQTDKHHSRQFAIFPEMVGFTHDDLARLPMDRQSDYVGWAIAYTNLMLASGWVRIDFTSSDGVAIWAGGVDWAEA